MPPAPALIPDPAPLPDPSELIRLLDRWVPRRIVVAGDFMLDRYAYGNAERLSPDAPVPVLCVEREENKPGGAANVCLDLRALRCDVAALGVRGDDGFGRLLADALRDAGIDPAGLVIADDRPTTVKQNLVGLAQHRHPQKMFRLDTERKGPLPDAVADRLLAAAEPLLEGADVLCLEDYGKGVLTPRVCAGLIAMAKAKGVPVYVDPAAEGDYTKYRGATTITPNRTEAERATGLNTRDGNGETLRRMAAQLLEELELETVVLTLDKQGALLLGRGSDGRPGEPVLVPTVARSVYDVTGAGDMVLAMLASSRANGADWAQAVALANVAAGLEVEKFGIVPIELGEILLSLLRLNHDELGKLRTPEQLAVELDAHRAAGHTIAFTNGCFDILHAGHVAYLREARKRGDLLVVGLNSDDSIRRIKRDKPGPPRPVNTAEDRVMVLSELQSVDYIAVFDDDTPLRLIETVKPDVLVKGADYQRENVVGGDFVEARGGRVELVDLVEGRSTTNILQRLGSTL